MALDLQQLHAELETAKANFNSWALNSIETADDTRRRHLDFIRDSKVQMEKLMDRQQELSQQAQILKQRLQQESAQEVELQARLATLQAEKAALPRQVAQLEAGLAAEREQLQRQQARLAAESRQQERTMHSLTADLQTYRSQLGMRILSQPDPEGPQELRIVLTLVDPQDHGREFCLGVVLEEDKYKVTHCQPECGAMVELLKELNGDGNFGQFVRSMRKAWQQQLS